MTSSIKRVSVPGYNTVFNLESGFFARWGDRTLDDPQFCPLGPELLDIEISTVCSRACSWCYKSNTKAGRNMSLATFREILDRVLETTPNPLNQIAFGIGDIDANPDLYAIMEQARRASVVPNLTINGERMDSYHYDRLVGLCGAVAVSLYDIDTCLDAVYELTRRGLKQVNIHVLFARETLPLVEQLTAAVGRDKRIENLDAIVLLRLKPKGRRNQLHQVPRQEFEQLLEQALRQPCKLGMDSCSAPVMLSVVDRTPELEGVRCLIEPCESTLFSLYVNVDGKAYPCSFCEGQPGVEGVDVSGEGNFIDEVWRSPVLEQFRGRLLKNNRECPVYSLE